MAFHFTVIHHISMIQILSNFGSISLLLKLLHGL